MKMNVMYVFWGQMLLVLQVGLGNCAKDMWVDPIGAAEGAWRNAWDLAVGTVGAFGDAVTNDFHEVSVHGLKRGHGACDEHAAQNGGCLEAM